MPADNSDELFEVFDAHGRLSGTAPRGLVHRQGLLHKAVHVFVFNAAGDLLLQRRATAKDLYPGYWDGSLGEHVQPGESFTQAAIRGLQEELGICNCTVHASGDPVTLRLTGPGFDDYECQQLFTARYDGALVVDDAEVAAIEWHSLANLQHLLASGSRQFTPWFVTHFTHAGLTDQNASA